jgi:methionyl-tRNA formyltransferase
LRTVYLGTSPFAAAVLEHLAGTAHRPELVVTRPDRPRGRGRALQSPPVAEAARALGIELIQPEALHDPEVLERISAASPGVLVVCAFGVLVREPLLSRYEIFNVHPSLLPRWRGAAPVERAILAGDAETGVDLMVIEKGLDTGAVFATARTPIRDDETAGELHARLVELSTQLLLDTLPDLPRMEPTPQAGEATYAEKLTVEEFELDPDAPGPKLARLVRAGNPRPGAWLVYGGKRLKVWRGHLEGERFVPDEVQPEGKKAMTYEAWLAGHHGAAPFA